MSGTTLSLMRLAQVFALSLFVCIVAYFSINPMLNLFAQSPEVVCSNPGFETGDLSCWGEGGDEGFVREVQTQTVLEGNYAALIGDPFETQDECAGNLPLGSAWISYVFTVPVHGDPYFSFKYRLFSYDEMHGDRFDKFDVYIDDLSDSQPRFRVLRAGSQDGVPSGSSRPCNFPRDDSGPRSAGWSLSAIPDFDNPGPTYDLRGKRISVTFQVFSQEPEGTSAWYNTWVIVDNLQLWPEMVMHKSNDPSGPVHEGDVITYTISYANTGLIPQTNIVITDKIPSNTDLVTGTISSGGTLMHNGVISWTFESLAVGETGAVSFQVRIPLLRHLQEESVSPLCPPTPTPPPPARVLPAAISCDTTRFWASGVTRQPPVSPPYTIEVQIPPNTSPSEIWLLMKGIDNTAPRIDDQPALPLKTISDGFGASLWTAPITPTMVGDSQMVTITTWNPRKLNAIFLFERDHPPFDERDLRVFAEPTTTFTYTLEIPTVETQTMDVLLPFMDITSWTDSSPPEFDGRMTTVTVKLEGQPTQTITVNQPNMGNGLLMTQFPIDIGPFPDAITKTEVLTISVDTEDDAVYTLGPRVCRPVYVENTAWLCSKEAGCISSTVKNIPIGFAPPSVYLPIILKSSP